MRFFRIAFLFFSGWCGLVNAAPSLDSARQAYEQKDFRRAETELNEIVAAEPNNAEANFYLGVILARGQTAEAFESALPYLKKAADLNPDSSKYIAEYGGISFLLAGKTRSLSAATHGRDAMVKAISLDPNNLNAREGLMQFYFQAPWPLGSSAKATVQLEEIRKRDFNRGTTLLIQEKAREKKYPEALKVCEEVLAQDPRNVAALYQFGWVSDASGLQPEKGLSCLNTYREIVGNSLNPSANAATWAHIGGLREKLGQKKEAAEAFARALELDPNRKDAGEGLARVKT